VTVAGLIQSHGELSSTPNSFRLSRDSNERIDIAGVDGYLIGGTQVMVDDQPPSIRLSIEGSPGDGEIEAAIAGDLAEFLPVIVIDDGELLERIILL